MNKQLKEWNIRVTNSKIIHLKDEIRKIRTLRNQIHDVYSWVSQEHEQTAKKMKYTWNPARRESSLSTSRSCKSHKYQIVSRETV